MRKPATRSGTGLPRIVTTRGPDSRTAAGRPATKRGAQRGGSRGWRPAFAAIPCLLPLLFQAPCAAESRPEQPAENSRHLFILSGQSNMTAGVEAGFRDVLHRELGEARVSIVRHSKSGRGIRFWVEDYTLPEDHPLHDRLGKGNGEEFPKLLASARAAGDAGDFATVTFVWMQGESDANRNLAAAYAQSFTSLLTRLKEELGIARLFFVIGRISDHGLHGDSTEGWEAIRRVQMELADSDPLGAWIDTDDLNGGDEDRPQGDLHYPGDQYPELGARLAKAALRQLRESNLME